MKQYSFEKLEVWQNSKELTISIYKLTDTFPSDEKFGLVSQLRRASVSIATNLAEGSGRTNKNDKAHFTQIAYGSLMEVLNLLLISEELKFIAEHDLIEFRKNIEVISKQLSNLRRSQLNP